MTKIQEILFSYQDEKYADFTAKLIPTEKREIFIGVRSPALKKIVPDVLTLGDRVSVMSSHRFFFSWVVVHN